MPFSNWWKCTLWSCVAENSRTGTFTSPNETEPVQIDLAMSPPPPRPVPRTGWGQTPETAGGQFQVKRLLSPVTLTTVAEPGPSSTSHVTTS